jgi:hypothetical protein
MIDVFFLIKLFLVSIVVSIPLFLISRFSQEIRQFFLWFVNPYRFLMCKFTGEEFVPIIS